MQTDFIGMLISHQILIPLPLWSSCPIFFSTSENDAEVCSEWMVGWFSSPRWHKQRYQAKAGTSLQCYENCYETILNKWKVNYFKTLWLYYNVIVSTRFLWRFLCIQPAIPHVTRGWPLYTICECSLPNYSGLVRSTEFSVRNHEVIFSMSLHRHKQGWLIRRLPGLK